MLLFHAPFLRFFGFYSVFSTSLFSVVIKPNACCFPFLCCVDLYLMAQSLGFSPPSLFLRILIPNIYTTSSPSSITVILDSEQVSLRLLSPPYGPLPPSRLGTINTSLPNIFLSPSSFCRFVRSWKEYAISHPFSLPLFLVKVTAYILIKYSSPLPQKKLHPPLATQFFSPASIRPPSFATFSPPMPRRVSFSP